MGIQVSLMSLGQSSKRNHGGLGGAVQTPEKEENYFSCFYSPIESNDSMGLLCLNLIEGQ